MDVQPDSPTEHGIGGSLNWLISGAIAGIVSSLVFGGVLWAINPAIVTQVIPAVYGLTSVGIVGWGFHLIHGLVLGVIFGFLVTRAPILGTLTADVETGFIAAMGPGLRLAGAGIVYGLAVWTALPVIFLSIWDINESVPVFPALTPASLVGHLLYGLLLGALFSVFVEIAHEAEETEAPFEEASDPPQE